jgi:hypothetical protein
MEQNKFLHAVDYNHHLLPCIPRHLIFKYDSAGIVFECYKIFYTRFGWHITSMAGLSRADQNTCIVLLCPIYPATTPNIPNIYRLACATTVVICPSLDSYISKRTSPNTRYYIHLSTLSSSLSFYHLFPFSLILLLSFQYVLSVLPFTRNLPLLFI